jgi:type VI secretion system ImpB/VipA family protein
MRKPAFTLSFQTSAAESAIYGERPPMRILVLGDFLGQAGGSAAAALPTRDDVRRIDIDTFERVMAVLGPSVSLGMDDRGRVSEPLAFRCLDDFHPDRLARQDPVLKQLAALKDQLKDPASFQTAAAVLQSDLGVHGADNGHREAAGDNTNASQEQSETDADTLERLLGAKSGSAAALGSPRRSTVDEMIRRLVAPQISVPLPDAGPYLATADAAAEDRLGGLLHDPSFQALEAAWRSIYGLVSQVETDEDLQIAMLSLDRDGLGRALDEAEQDPEQSALYRLLSDSAEVGPNAAPWSLIVGDYAFGPDDDNLRHLARMGAICQRLGATFLAAARPEILGCPDLLTHPHPRDWGQLTAEALSRWDALRSSAAARAIALALPRVLLRLPYGQSADPCDRFSFEEMPSPPRHDAFLWGNPAFLCALVLAQAYRDGEDSPRYADVEDMPAFVYREGDEMRMQACAEVYLSDAAGESIQKGGCIPVLSYQGRNAVRLGPMQTLAKAKTGSS